jgi:hypothetical protein
MELFGLVFTTVLSLMSLDTIHGVRMGQMK